MPPSGMEASAVANIIRPIGGTNVPVSQGGSFQDHVNRTPTSVNPGTDYAVGVGTKVLAPAAGIIKIADTGAGGAGGRTINIWFDDGGCGDLMHLSQLLVSAGQHVTQGQLIAYSGSSANGSDNPANNGGIYPHLHFSYRPTAQTTCYCNQGNVDPETHLGGTIGANQRQVRPAGPEVLRRLTPDRSQPDIDPDLQPGEIGNFDGWIHGEHVTTAYADTTVWYRGVSGNWFWAGGFTEISGHDLADLNPPPPSNLADRTVLPALAANVRSASNTNASIVGSYPAGSKQTFGFWQKGQSVTQNGVTTDTWYVSTDQTGFSWAGAYTEVKKDGLTELPGVPIPPSPWPDTPYAFEKAGDFVTRVAPAHWSNFENQYSVPNPAERKGFPALPTSIVQHQWGVPGAYTISSVINTFQGVHNNTSDRVSAHFVVNADEIVQMVYLGDRAYHAGSGGNDFVGIEIDPYVSEGYVFDAQGIVADPNPALLTERARKIIANVIKINEFLEERNGGTDLTNKLHRDIPGAATSCGTYIFPILPLINVSGDPQPEPPDPIPDTPPVWFTRFVTGAIRFLEDFLAGK